MSNRLQRHPSPPTLLREFGHTEAPQDSPAPYRAMWQGVIASLTRWLDEQRQRRGSVLRLQQLNDWMLRDIGIDRDDIEGSVDRGLWELRLQQAPRTGRETHRVL